MTTTLNIPVEPALMATIAGALKNAELGRLMRALIALMGGEDPGEHLNNSGIRLAFALLRPSLDDAIERRATNRANGARGGRPRKPTVQAVAPSHEEGGFQSVFTKKTKKEDLPPTPPIEEKNKKNNITLSSSPAGTREAEQDIRVTALPPLPAAVPTHEQLQQQMLGEQPWLEQLCMSRGIRPGDMARYVQDFILYLKERDLRETLPHAKAHFVNQLPYILNKLNNNHEKRNDKTHQEFIADPVARRRLEHETRRQETCRAIAQLAVQGQRAAAVPF